MQTYGKLPDVLGEVGVPLDEVAYVLYFPVSVPSSSTLMLPYPWMEAVRPLLDAIRRDEPQRFLSEYVYLTVKKMIVGPSITPNRPGWHADGFGTDDLNYVWYDCVPTVFNCSKFSISNDHIKSLEEFEQQAKAEYDVVYPPGVLLKLDPSVVHRVALPDKEQMRTFVKVSISKNQYNLKGNSINHALDKWPMYDRALVRNDPSKAQRDYFTPTDDHFK